MAEIRPQPQQERFLSTSADIGIYGGAAGAGKTFVELMEPIRHLSVPRFGATIFRTTSPQITNQGGLWDTSLELYPGLGGVGTQNPHMWRFPSGARVEFRHLQYDKDVHDYQGSQIPLIEFDELTHFSAFRFWYMMSRNRSTCGVDPYMRATTNPDPDSWVKDLILWWLDENGEYPREDRAGVIRYFVRESGELHWFDDRSTASDFAVRCGLPRQAPKSFTFIPGRLEDNKILMERNPGYLATLLALPRVERARLHGGNWKIKAGAGDIFARSDFEIVDNAPYTTRIVRAWDRAASEPKESNPNPDYSVGVKMAEHNGIYYVLDVKRMRKRAGAVRQRIKTTAAEEKGTIIGLFQDPGAAGKGEYEDMIRYLAGHTVRPMPQTGKKYTRWNPLAAQAQNGNLKLVRGPWNEVFIDELTALTEDEAHDHDDQADAASGAFYLLSKMPGKLYDYKKDHKTIAGSLKTGGEW